MFNEEFYLAPNLRRNGKNYITHIFFVYLRPILLWCSNHGKLMGLAYSTDDIKRKCIQYFNRKTWREL